MKVLQTHVLVCFYVILGNESIRLQNTQTLENSKRNIVSKTGTQQINKQFTQSSWATSPV